MEKPGVRSAELLPLASTVNLTASSFSQLLVPHGGSERRGQGEWGRQNILWGQAFWLTNNHHVSGSHKASSSSIPFVKFCSSTTGALCTRWLSTSALGCSPRVWITIRSAQSQWRVRLPSQRRLYGRIASVFSFAASSLWRTCNTVLTARPLVHCRQCLVSLCETTP